VATLLQFSLGFATVGTTVVLHLVGLALILRLLELCKERLKRTRIMQMILMGSVVCGILALHMAEISVYALIFWLGGALAPYDIALYFSATTFTTIGYGDVTVDGAWRLFAALEGLTGITLVGWSVAFLVTVVRRLDQWLGAESAGRLRR